MGDVITKQPALAKLSRPKLFGVVGRDRLFTLLDKERNNRSVVWIAGPPGAGKTSLVASYLEARKLPAIWYQVDSSDSDPATFFYYLGLAGRKAAGKKRLLLPLLTPEYLSDLPRFSRRFFRKLFASLPANALLVLDNYQEVTPGSVFHTVIQDAIAELPLGISLLVISHVDPSPQFARPLANNLIGRIDWEELRLTLEETKAIAAAAGLRQPDEDTFLLLQDQTNGWAAGLVLMMERLKRSGVVNHISQSETMESVFNYFAGQIFDQAPLDMRTFLMRTAILPHMTVNMAIAISGSEQAKELLDYLYRRRLFIDRRAGDEMSYQSHALFREFLLHRANNHFSRSELFAIKREAAYLVEQNDGTEAAAKLFAEAEAWKELIRLISEHAPALLAQGRNQILLGLIGLVPVELAKATPWIQYWRGISSMNFDQQAAIIDFEHAYAGFQMMEDRIGLFLTIGALIETHFFKSVLMAPVLPWAEKLQQLLIEDGGFPSVEIEAEVLANLQGLVFAAPHHSLFSDYEQRIDRLLRTNIEPRLRIAIGNAFLWWALWRGDFRKSRHIINEINSTVNHAYMPPMTLILWKAAEGDFAWCTGQHQLAVQKFSEGLEISRQAGLPLFDCMLWGISTYSALSAGDAIAARRCLDNAESLVNPQSKLAVAELRSLRSGVQFLEGDMDGACISAKQALALHEEVSAPFMISTTRIGLAQILIEADHMEEARHHLSRAIQYADTMKSDLLKHQALLIEAYSWIKSSEEPKAIECLRKGLRIAADNHYLTLNFWWRPQVMAGLFSIALQSKIEVSYVKSVIRRRNIKSESRELDIWPWPIRIFTLGRFEILCDDVPLHSSGKAQHKPLELLKCLCAYGGHAVHQDRLTDILWPDAEGDAAEQTLKITLHRLRKLLQHDQAVRLEDRHLSLDADYVWVDCMTFDRVAHHPDMTDRVSLQRALNRYRGPFLEGETASWALTCRDRFRAHYMSMAERFGTMLEQEGNWSGAVACYLQAIEVEPVAESFYRHLMTSYVHLGRRAEALAVYQRCRQSLLTRLDISPSKETQALYQTLINT